MPPGLMHPLKQDSDPTLSSIPIPQHITATASSPNLTNVPPKPWDSLQVPLYAAPPPPTSSPCIVITPSSTSNMLSPTQSPPYIARSCSPLTQTPIRSAVIQDLPGTRSKSSPPTSKALTPSVSFSCSNSFLSPHRGPPPPVPAAPHPISRHARHHSCVMQPISAYSDPNSTNSESHNDSFGTPISKSKSHSTVGLTVRSCTCLCHGITYMAKPTRQVPLQLLPNARSLLPVHSGTRHVTGISFSTPEVPEYSQRCCSTPGPNCIYSKASVNKRKAFFRVRSSSLQDLQQCCNNVHLSQEKTTNPPKTVDSTTKHTPSAPSKIIRSSSVPVIYTWELSMCLQGFDQETQTAVIGTPVDAMSHQQNLKVGSGSGPSSTVTQSSSSSTPLSPAPKLLLLKPDIAPFTQLPAPTGLSFSETSPGVKKLEGGLPQDLLHFAVINDVQKFPVILLTHHYFLTTEEFVSTLLSKYENPSPENPLDPSQLNCLQEQILKCLVQWADIQQNFSFEWNSIASQFLNFFFLVLKKEHQALGNTLKARLKTKLLSSLSHDESLQLLTAGDPAFKLVTAQSPRSGSVSPSASPPIVSPNHSIEGSNSPSLDLNVAKNQLFGLVKLKKKKPQLEGDASNAPVTTSPSLLQTCTDPKLSLLLDVKALEEAEVLQNLTKLWKYSSYCRAHTRNIQNFPQSFIGEEVVLLAKEQMHLSVKKILDLGNELLQQRVIFHPKGKMEFKNTHSLYLFTMTPQERETWPEPLIPKTPKDPRKGYSLMDIHPNELARQLTILAHTLVSAISIQDLSFKSWEKFPDRKTNLSQYTSFSNKMSYWVAYEIVTHSNIKMRACAISRWIQTAKQCKQYNNFNTAAEIIFALQRRHIYRLKRTWKEVPRSDVQMFEALSEFMSAEGNFCRLREVTLLVSQTEAVPFIPYVVLWLRDLIYIEDNPKMLPSNKQHVNFHNLDLLSQVFGMLLRSSKFEYRFKKIFDLQKYLQNVKTPTDEQLERLSSQCEPADL
ncbi:Ras guanine nucleotide exchange factor Q [Pelomyxa schiedti]|nr:Ras guanine nucleotide exchange factor Q [Pelomyxa schiedti]